LIAALRAGVRVAKIVEGIAKPRIAPIERHAGRVAAKSRVRAMAWIIKARPSHLISKVPPSARFGRVIGIVGVQTMDSAHRRIDHVVLAVLDLDATGEFYRRLGFQVGARNRHPWGTENRLIQFRSSFIELITVGDPTATPEHSDGQFSFGAHVRDYLREREGFAMLSLDSDDAAADATLFAERGIGSFEPFFFERKGRRPDGSETHVAFSLAFAADPKVPAACFFVCQQHFPQNFWNPDFQLHPNGAIEINAVCLASPAPETHATFLASFAGAFQSRTVGGALSFELKNGGHLNAVRREGSTGLASFTVRIADRPRQIDMLRAGNVPFTDDGQRTAVSSRDAYGVELVFESDAE
jgi:catechol 2,3-dioxygenase-like lactoylglutathione lyase family enzyme